MKLTIIQGGTLEEKRNKAKQILSEEPTLLFDSADYVQSFVPEYAINRVVDTATIKLAEITYEEYVVDALDDDLRLLLIPFRKSGSIKPAIYNAICKADKRNKDIEIELIRIGDGPFQPLPYCCEKFTYINKNYPSYNKIKQHALGAFKNRKK